MSAFAVVNGTNLDFDDAARILWLDNAQFAQPLIETVVVRQYAASVGLSVTVQELQVAADEMRYANDLESLDSLKQWLREKHQNLASFEYWLEGILLRNKIMASFTEDELTAYYADHRLDYERIALYSCRVGSEAKAAELLELIREGESFLAIAKTHSLDHKTSFQGGFVGMMGRKDVTPELESLLFNAPVNEPVGPVKTSEGFNIFMVTANLKPTFEETKANLNQDVYFDLIAKLSASAEIGYPWAALAAAGGK